VLVDYNSRNHGAVSDVEYRGASAHTHTDIRLRTNY